jgi:4-hydroxyphenylacetate 3-monooxygenase
VQTRIAQLVGFHQTMRSHQLAAEYEGFHSPGGHWKPNILIVDFGRAYFLENLPRMVHELVDLCGRAAIIFPTQKQWEDPALHGWFEMLQTGPTKKPEDRIKISRVVRDMFLTSWSDRQKMFDNFQGTPLMMIRFLTMRRAEFAADGPATVMARQLCGIAQAVKDDETEYTAQADYARAQDAAAAR